MTPMLLCRHGHARTQQKARATHKVTLGAVRVASLCRKSAISALLHNQRAMLVLPAFEAPRASVALDAAAGASLHQPTQH